MCNLEPSISGVRRDFFALGKKQPRSLMRQGGLILAAGRVHSKYKKRNPTTLKTHHEIHSSPATATTLRRRATKHVPRVSPYSHASIDPGFVEIGLACIRTRIAAVPLVYVLVLYFLAGTAYFCTVIPWYVSPVSVWSGGA